MDRRLEQLLDFLDAESEDSVGTSVRLPTNLRDAAVVAADMGLAASTTELTVRGLRDALEAFAQRAVLDAHYRSYPEAAPTSSKSRSPLLRSTAARWLTDPISCAVRHRRSAPSNAMPPRTT